MSHFKKVLSLVLVCIILCLSFAGCAPSQNQPYIPVLENIKLMMLGDGTALTADYPPEYKDIFFLSGITYEQMKIAYEEEYDPSVMPTELTYKITEQKEFTKEDYEALKEERERFIEFGIEIVPVDKAYHLVVDYIGSKEGETHNVPMRVDVLRIEDKWYLYPDTFDTVS